MTHNRNKVSVTHGKRGAVFDQLVTMPESTTGPWCLSFYQEPVKTVTEYHAIATDLLNDKPLPVTVSLDQSLSVYQYKTICRFNGINQYTELDFRHIGTYGIG